MSGTSESDGNSEKNENFNQLDNFEPNNTSSSSSEEEIEIPTKKVRQQWNLEQTFRNAEDIRIFFTQEPHWKQNTTNKNSDGIKTYYRCNIVKKKGKQCPAKIMLFEKNVDSTTELHRNPNIHDHESDGVLLSSVPLSPEITNKIKQLYLLNLKKREILHKVNTDETIVNKPTRIQVIIFLIKI